MNLQQIHDTAASRSYFSRPDAEVWIAINSGSLFAYQFIVKEIKDYFLTTDTTSLTIVPQQQEYSLPPDLIQIRRLRERVNAQDAYRHIDPIDMNDDEAEDDFPAPQISFPGGSSNFTYQGPYLTQADAIDGQDDQTYSIWIQPIPQDTRQCEIKYISKYVEVYTVNDAYMMPIELRDAVLDLATAELLRGNNDDLADVYVNAAMGKLNAALTLARERQSQHPPTVTPYLSEYM